MQIMKDFRIFFLLVSVWGLAGSRISAFALTLSHKSIEQLWQCGL